MSEDPSSDSSTGDRPEAPEEEPGRTEEASGRTDEASGEEEAPEGDAHEGGADAPSEDGKSGEAGDDGGARPISVRDLMPEPSPERRRREPERRARDAETPTEPAPPTPDAGVPAEDEEDEEEAEAARPTPVRVAMDAPPPGDSRPVDSLPSRRFEVEGQAWVVRITGRTITGTRPDPGALLMQLHFFRAEEPETPARELLTVDRPLEALYPEDLEEYLERSRPVEAAAT